MRARAISVPACAVILLSACPRSSSFAQDGAQDGPQAAPPGPRLSTVRRLLRHFDFEEAERRPTQMPDRFYRYGAGPGGVSTGGAAAQGFPLFGTMRLTDEMAHGGAWSFLFDLDGGSMAARTPTAVLPALPMNSYRVEVAVRTEGLVHARARLVAWLYDVHGQIIETTLVHSEGVRSEGHWRLLAVEVEGRPEAADVGVELQLVQPQQYMGASLALERPVPADHSGRVWFDDLRLWSLPRLEITSTAAVGGVFEGEGPRRLTVTVEDRASRRPLTTVRVLDIDGRAVVRQVLPGGRGPHHVDVTALSPGWYESIVELTDEGALAGSRRAGFVIMPAGPRRAGAALGVTIADPQPADAAMVRALGAACAVVLVQGPQPGTDWQEDIYPSLRSAVEAMLDEGLEVTIASSLEGAPEPGAGETQPLDLLVARFGQRVARWQIGLDPASAPSGSAPGLPAESARFGDVRWIVPWPAEQQIGAEWPGIDLNVHVPLAFAPAAIGTLAGQWLDRGGTPIVTLETPPDGLYAPRAALVDAMLRGLYAWRAGLPRIVIAAPWRGAAGPDPAFAAWRTLADRLSGRRFVGEIPLAEGTSAWLIARESGDDAAIVAWSQRHAADGIAEFLGAGPLHTVDAFGNDRPVALRNGVHEIALAETPIFIEGIDLLLAKFRAGVRLEPEHITAAHRVHEHELVLSNPWDVPLSGTVHLQADRGWSITPRFHPFTVPARGTLRLPVNVTPDRSAIAGPRVLSASFAIEAGSIHRFTARLPVEIGIDDLDVSAQWRVEAANDEEGRTRSDLIVRLNVANHGPDAIDLEAFLYAGPISLRRQSIGALAPGQRSVQTFRIEDGVALLSGVRAFIGVDERRGSRRLTRILDLPELVQP